MKRKWGHWMLKHYPWQPPKVMLKFCCVYMNCQDLLKKLKHQTMQMELMFTYQIFLWFTILLTTLPLKIWNPFNNQKLSQFYCFSDLCKRQEPVKKTVYYSLKFSQKFINICTLQCHLSSSILAIGENITWN